MKELKCGSVIPGCDWTIRGDCDAEVIRRACQHMRHTHGVDVITDTMMHAIRLQIEKTRQPHRQNMP